MSELLALLASPSSRSAACWASSTSAAGRDADRRARPAPAAAAADQGRRARGQLFEALREISRAAYARRAASGHRLLGSARGCSPADERRRASLRWGEGAAASDALAAAISALAARGGRAASRASAASAHRRGRARRAPARVDAAGAGDAIGEHRGRLVRRRGEQRRRLRPSRAPAARAWSRAATRAPRRPAASASMKR